MGKHGKYTLSYCSGATGYGWHKECQTLEEAEGFIASMKRDGWYTAFLQVWDNVRNVCIFEKRVLCLKPETDDLHRADRDYRTITRNKKR